MASTVRKAHKWMAVGVSVILLLWTVSGIVMILPAPATWPAGALPPQPLEFREAQVSPAAAADQALHSVGGVAQVRGVSLKLLAGRLTYQVDLRPGGPHLVDAATGNVIVVTPEVAERIARAGFPASIGTQAVERLTEHDRGYPGGPLPVYRVTFDDPAQTITYVTESDGGARRGTRASRIRNWMISFHDLSGLRALVPTPIARQGTMTGAGAVVILAIITGWVLAWPRRRRRTA